MARKEPVMLQFWRSGNAAGPLDVASYINHLYSHYYPRGGENFNRDYSDLQAAISDPEIQTSPLEDLDSETMEKLQQLRTIFHKDRRNKRKATGN